MDIIVEGIGKKYYKPNQTIINLNFYTKTKTYETVLEKGAKDVEIFIKNVIEKMNFSKEDLKTSNFRIYEEKRYDYENKKEIKEGFAYTQSATFEFEYDINTMSEFMQKVSKLENPPKYSIEFFVKDIQNAKNETIEEAYKMAKEKAQIIAKAAGKKLRECIKTDFRPFSETICSGTMLNEDANFFTSNTRMKSADKCSSIQKTISNIFTPKDIEIIEKLYCLWIAE